MKRIDVNYGGDVFSIGGRDAADVQREIEGHMRAGGGWLQVNSGEGSARPALLYIAPGATVALLPVVGLGDDSGPDDDGPGEAGRLRP